MAALWASDLPPGERRMPFGHTEGTKLKDLTTKELENTRRWCAEKDDKRGKPHFKDLIDAIDQVLEDRASDQIGFTMDDDRPRRRRQ